MRIEASVIVITMNRRDDVLRCLSALRPQLRPCDEIVLVDNRSQDGTAEAVAAAFPEVVLVRAERNHGVAGGRNLGIQRARGEFLVFIDDDAEFAGPDAVAQAVRLLRAHPRAAVLGFDIRSFHDGRPEYAAIARRDKTPLPGTRPSAYFCGCGFAMRTSALAVTGAFWEPLVYGGEELDLSYRILSRGFEIVQTDQIVVLHRKVGTARPGGQYFYFNARNRLWIAARSLPFANVVTTALLWWAYLLAKGLRCGQLAPVLRGVRDGIAGLREALAGRGRVQPSRLRRIGQLSGRVWY